MATEKQLTANRRNAQFSTGPKSTAGKIKSAKNSLSFGLFSDEVVLSGEDPQLLVEFRQEFFDHFQPVGALEVMYTDRAVSLAWRLRRPPRIEAGIFNRSDFNRIAAEAEQTGERYFPNQGEPYAEPCNETAEFVRDSQFRDTLSKVYRAEAFLERSFFKTVLALERLQAVRAGKDVPVPLAVDVNVSGVESLPDGKPN